MDEPFSPPERPSKSQLKRDSAALQALGEELVALRPDQLRRLELPPPLLEAIEDAQRIRAHEGRRRQLQYIGKLMRAIDAEPIRAALAALREPHLHERAHLHRIERWRERLLTEGDTALSELLAQFPSADSQQLRQWVRSAQQEAGAGKPPQAARKLFKYLRGLLESVRGEE